MLDGDGVLTEMLSRERWRVQGKELDVQTNRGALRLRVLGMTVSR